MFSLVMHSPKMEKDVFCLRVCVNVNDFIPFTVDIFQDKLPLSCLDNPTALQTPRMRGMVYSIFIFAIGIVFGSLINVLTDRLPNRENPFKCRSHLDYCKIHFDSGEFSSGFALEPEVYNR